MGNLPSWLKGLAALFLTATLAVAGAVVHDSVTRARRPGGADPGWYLTGLTGNHSTTSATPVDRQFVQGSDTYLVVFLRGSTSAATGTIEVWGSTASDGTLDMIVGKQTFTLGTDDRAAGGYQPNQPLAFSCAGLTAYDVRCTVLSGGTLDIKAFTCGAASVAAE